MGISVLFLAMLGLGVMALVALVFVVRMATRAPGLRDEHLIEENRQLREEIDRLRRGQASGENQ